ncbi:DUF239 domain-containing protein [Actinoplanes sp. ATCC 53533]|uniref:neprosin family prolyl endopeptidase n=1 Tax=Actinoplanes sp. ATCC 53533 TaxID=1288362 RepID=UPI000F7AF615|nr:neprosin family prolyl endopeptidase [Actinoplanes sp. ATCC 53533]RSM62115.1 DUF239 domain-containing protein [Actinoplanes sp. ATCC 53533]
MGVVWTLNADAAETPGVETPAVVTAPVSAAAEPVPVPPRLLPWGEKPKKLKRAKAGANSKAVAAAGAAAAPADTSGSMIPKPKYGPKGLDGVDSGLTPAVPPAPPAVAKAAAAPAPDGRPDFYHAGYEQVGETDGSWANLTIEQSKLLGGDYHTLAEIAVRSADEESKQTVEVGWNVDPSVNGDTDPHLFVFHWREGKPQCYNACGFVQYSKTVKPGDTLPAGAQKRFGIQHSGGVWWIAYDSEWIGHFPDSLWGGKYTKAGAVQWFGEVVSPDAVLPCSEMGNGKLAADLAAARIGSISMTNGPVVSLKEMAKVPYYTMKMADEIVPTTTTFRYGGTGVPC